MRSLIVIAAIAFALGTAETVFDNAAQAILPNMVERRRAPRLANGRLFAAEVVTNHFVGPPLGAFLFTAAAAAPFFLDAASFGIAAVVVLGFRGSFRPVREFAEGEPRPTIRADIAEGLRWLRGHRLLRTLAIVLGVLNLLDAGVLAVVRPLRARGARPLEAGLRDPADRGRPRRAGREPPGPAAERLGRPRHDARSSRCSCIGAATLVPALVGQPDRRSASRSRSSGRSASAWNVVTVSLRQAIVPDALLGRVNSAYRLLGWGTMPIGALLGGFLADAFGLRAPFVIGGVIPIVMGLAMIPLDQQPPSRRPAGSPRAD